MRFVIDECLYVELRDILNREGHEAEHVVDIGLRGRPDTEVMSAAVDREAVLLTADRDFGELLARQGGNKPSVVLFRRKNFTAEDQAAVLLANFDEIKEALEAGVIVVFGDESRRLRLLPIVKDDTERT